MSYTYRDPITQLAIIFPSAIDYKAREAFSQLFHYLPPINIAIPVIYYYSHITRRTHRSRYVSRYFLVSRNALYICKLTGKISHCCDIENLVKIINCNNNEMVFKFTRGRDIVMRLEEISETSFLVNILHTIKASLVNNNNNNNNNNNKLIVETKPIDSLKLEGADKPQLELNKKKDEIKHSPLPVILLHEISSPLLYTTTDDLLIMMPPPPTIKQKQINLDNNNNNNNNNILFTSVNTSKLQESRVNDILNYLNGNQETTSLMSITRNDISSPSPMIMKTPPNYNYNNNISEEIAVGALDKMKLENNTLLENEKEKEIRQTKEFETIEKVETASLASTNTSTIRRIQKVENTNNNNNNNNSTNNNNNNNIIFTRIKENEINEKEQSSPPPRIPNILFQTSSSISNNYRPPPPPIYPLELLLQNNNNNNKSTVEMQSLMRELYDLETRMKCLEVKSESLKLNTSNINISETKSLQLSSTPFHKDEGLSSQTKLLTKTTKIDNEKDKNENNEIIHTDAFDFEKKIALRNIKERLVLREYEIEQKLQYISIYQKNSVNTRELLMITRLQGDLLLLLQAQRIDEENNNNEKEKEENINTNSEMQKLNLNDYITEEDIVINNNNNNNNNIDIQQEEDELNEELNNYDMWAVTDIGKKWCEEYLGEHLSACQREMVQKIFK